MNVLDWVLIALFAAGAIWGFRTGLVDAVLNLVAIYVALLLSGQFAGRVLGLFTDSVESEALSTAIGYVIIFFAVFLASRILSKIIKATMNAMFVGWTDKVGGVAIGIIAGVLLAGGLMAVMARFAYVVPEEPEDSGGGIVASASDFAEQFLGDTLRGNVSGWLVDSQVVSVLVDIRGVTPGNMLGMAPADFNLALDVLEQRIQEDPEDAE